MADLMPQMHPTPAPPLQQPILQEPIQQQQQSIPTMPSVSNPIPMMDQSNGLVNNQPQQMEKAANDLAPTPRLQSNMYKLQRNRSKYWYLKILIQHFLN